MIPSATPAELCNCPKWSNPHYHGLHGHQDQVVMQMTVGQFFDAPAGTVAEIVGISGRSGRWYRRGEPRG